MLSGVLPWLSIVFVFGVVIFVHELGHFLAAKATGVYAPRFSIGFGPAIWSRKWGETEYVLASIPLGGYVRMASRDDSSMAILEGGTEQPAPENPTEGEALPRWYDPEAMAPFGPKPIPENRLFEAKSLPARLVIMLAGVTMNMLLAFAIYSAMAYSDGIPLLRTRVIGDVSTVASAPALGQLHQGDTIRAIDGRTVSAWNDVDGRFDSSAGPTMTLTTNRGTVTIPIGPPNTATRDSVAGAIVPYLAPVIGKVVGGMPAARGGIEAGDSVVTVGGDTVHTWYEMTSRVKQSPGRKLEFSVVRHGGAHTVTVRPDSVPAEDGGPPTGIIGAYQRSDIERLPVSVGQALSAGWQQTWGVASSVVTALRRLLNGTLSVRTLAGPVEIGHASYVAAQAGWATVLRLVALISVNLAIFNLLPVPILDGGQILVNVAEAVKGSALSMRTREYLMRFGLAVIALIFVIVMYNDITRLVKNLFGL